MDEGHLEYGYNKLLIYKAALIHSIYPLPPVMADLMLTITWLTGFTCSFPV